MAGFFKTGPGQYGEGDRFLGITVPKQRKVARAHRQLPLKEIGTLLRSRIHEERLTALLVLVDRYQRGDSSEKQRCFDFYLRNLKSVNNWDLVDTSAGPIVGSQLLKGDRRLLYRMARSKRLWERRVAIIATLAFIQTGEYRDTFTLARLLLSDEEDLIHKATGWMLREVGKRCGPEYLRSFLKANAPKMPRTALRYAIERFPERERRAWLATRRPRSN